MIEHTVNVKHAAAVILWALALVVATSGTAFLATDHPYVALGIWAHGVLVLAAAAVATVLHAIERSTRTLVNHLEIEQDMGIPLRRAR